MKVINNHAINNQMDNSNGASVSNSVHTQTAAPVAKAITLAEAGTLITFDSMQKVAFFLMGTFILSYCAVSPRTLELSEYNQQFKKNMQTVMLTFIVPVFTFLLVLEARENDLNSLVSRTSAVVRVCRFE